MISFRANILDKLMGQWIKNPIQEGGKRYDLKAMGKKDDFYDHFLIFVNGKYKFYGHQPTFDPSFYGDMMDFYYNPKFNCLVIIPKDADSNTILAMTYKMLANNQAKSGEFLDI